MCLQTPLLTLCLSRRAQQARTQQVVKGPIFPKLSSEDKRQTQQGGVKETPVTDPKHLARWRHRRIMTEYGVMMMVPIFD